MSIFKRRKYLKYKILLGYFIMIGFIFLIIFSMFYFFWKNYTQESIFKSMKNNNYQVENVIGYYLDNIIKLSEYPFTDYELTEILRKDYQDIKDGTQKTHRLHDINLANTKIYKNVFYMNKKIKSVWLFWGKSDSYAVRMRGTFDNSYRVENEKWFQTVVDGKGKPFIIGKHRDKGNIFKQDVVTIARSIVDPINGEYLGMILINTLAEDFATLWYSTDYGGSIIAVADNKNNLIFQDSKNKDFSEFEVFLSDNGTKFESDKSYKVKIGKADYYLVCSDLECMQGVIYQLNPEDAADEGSRIIFWGILCGSVLLGFILLLISVAISDSITKPISKLVASMNVVENGNLQIQTEEFEGELEVLSTTFNRMMNKMDDMFTNLQEKEKEKRNMEMLALQSQINPHFMYNTLNSVRWMAELQGVDNITQMIDALIKVLKYTAVEMEELVLVEDEIIFIKNYIKILNFRYFERFSFTYLIDPEVLQYRTPRFVLQPIIENAVLHGFDSTDLYATIEIKVFLEREYLIFEVTDNGRGISEKKCGEILTRENPKGKSLNRIGIYNINKRIQFLFGEEYTIQIQSKEGCYTKVIVKIPAMTGAEASDNGTDKLD